MFLSTHMINEATTVVEIASSNPFTLQLTMLPDWTILSRYGCLRACIAALSVSVKMYGQRPGATGGKRGQRGTRILRGRVLFSLSIIEEFRLHNLLKSGRSSVCTCLLMERLRVLQNFFLKSSSQARIFFLQHRSSCRYTVGQRCRYLLLTITTRL